MSHELIQIHSVRQHAEGETVGFCDAIDVIGGNQSAGAGHVLNDHFRIAGDIFRDITSEQTRPTIVKAARGESDDDLDGFALIKWRCLGS